MKLSIITKYIMLNSNNKLSILEIELLIIDETLLSFVSEEFSCLIDISFLNYSFWYIIPYFKFIILPFNYKLLYQLETNNNFISLKVNFNIRIVINAISKSKIFV